MAVPDLISPSYFPAIAAVDLGFFKREGLDVELELIAPIENGYAALRDGAVEFVAGSAHSAAAAFPDWRGVKLICAQSQGMYWFLVMRADIGARRGDVNVVKGRTIGAAPLVGLGLRRLLQESGIDLAADGVTIMPVPGSHGRKVNFGVTAARALGDGAVDGFWANGMGAELVVRSGAGSLVLDVRRGDGPEGCFDYTFPSIAVTDDFLAEHPEAAAAAVRAVKATQAALRTDPSLAREIGDRLFPAEEAALIEELVQRDLPYYDAAISPHTVAGLSAFSCAVGLAESGLSYTDVVAADVRHLWTGPD